MKSIGIFFDPEPQEGWVDGIWTCCLVSEDGERDEEEFEGHTPEQALQLFMLENTIKVMT
jgi:hypothetical protein